MQTSISERLLQLMNSKIDQARKFKILQEQTGIASDRWSSFSLGRQRPTAEMIQAAGRLWPENAFWLVTGIEDEIYGHVAPTKISKTAKDEFLLKIQEQREADPAYSEAYDGYLPEALSGSKFQRWKTVITKAETALAAELKEYQEWVDFINRKKQ